MLDSSRKAGAEEQAAALASRAAAHPLDDPVRVAWLLGSLLEAGAEEQAAVLLARDPAAHVALDDPAYVAPLLYTLQAAGADEQAAALADRLPGAGMFELSLMKEGDQDRFRFGRQPLRAMGLGRPGLTRPGSAPCG